MSAQLAKEYDLQSLEFVRIVEGRAINYRASTNTGDRFLVKIFQEKYPTERVLLASEFVKYLVAAGYPTVPFRSTRDGSSVTTHRGRALIVVPWIEGEPWPERALRSPTQLAHLGELCALAHALGKHFPDPLRLQEAPPPYLHKGAERFRAAAHSAFARGDDQLADQLYARLRVLDNLGRELERNAGRDRRNFLAIHGDFYSAHVVEATDCRLRVIDVMGGYYSPGWELFRTFFQSVKDATTMSQHDLGYRWRAFMGGYRSILGVSGEELALGFDTYLLQLTLSRYGLLGRDAAKRDQVLMAFGLCRTEMVMHLSKNRKAILDVVSVG